jgi:hypothetical protein
MASMRRALYTIANEIIAIWSRQGKGIYFGAVPYLRAMATLDSISDNYGADSGESIVAYALSNMTTFKGEDARRLKAELKDHLNSK